MGQSNRVLLEETDELESECFFNFYFRSNKNKIKMCVRKSLNYS